MRFTPDYHTNNQQTYLEQIQLREPLENQISNNFYKSNFCFRKANLTLKNFSKRAKLSKCRYFEQPIACMSHKYLYEPIHVNNFGSHGKSHLSARK